MINIDNTAALTLYTYITPLNLKANVDIILGYVGMINSKAHINLDSIQIDYCFLFHLHLCMVQVCEAGEAYT